ncbi:MAG: hypothetical protein LBJ73_03395 [Rickettsiales bacterium]|jgi:hypothetical protein|nr:hypothetical protein [Rickettsiales bacterium]
MNLNSILKFHRRDAVNDISTILAGGLTNKSAQRKLYKKVKNSYVCVDTDSRKQEIAHELGGGVIYDMSLSAVVDGYTIRTIKNDKNFGEEINYSLIITDVKNNDVATMRRDCARKMHCLLQQKKNAQMCIRA